MKDRKGAGGEKAGGAAVEFSLIPRETLFALYGELLKAKARRGAGSRGWKFNAATVAIKQDLVPGDTVIAELPVAATRQEASAVGRFGAELERAAGIALRHKTKQSGKLVVVFAMESRGDAWVEALEVARAHRLPMVFVTELREEKAAKSKRSPDPGTELARIVVDGHDAVASYRVAHEAIERARRDRGATLVECTAFRLKGRRQQDSVAMMKAYLRAKGFLMA